MARFAESRKTLLEERDAARRDARLKARFLSYRLNVPTADELSVLLTVDEWKRVLAREVPERRGRPVVGVDLGAGRAWSAATAVYPSGRVEAVAIAPGTPSLVEQEKRDLVPSGTYTRLAASGVLTTDGDRRVPRVGVLVERLMQWRPSGVTCDRFRLAEFQDAIPGRVSILPRIQRWSEASEDIRAVRRLALDGPLSVAHDTRAPVNGEPGGVACRVRRARVTTAHASAAPTTRGAMMRWWPWRSPQARIRGVDAARVGLSVR